MRCRQHWTDDSQNQLRRQSRCPIFKKEAEFSNIYLVNMSHYQMQFWRNFQNSWNQNLYHRSPPTSSRCPHNISNSSKATTATTKTGTTTPASSAEATTYPNSSNTYSKYIENICRSCSQTGTIISSTYATRTPGPSGTSTSSTSTSRTG